MNNNPGYWPSSIVPSNEKDLQKWGREVLDYAILRWGSNRKSATTYFERMRNSYNGIITPEQQAKIDSLYGAPNRMPFADFRISRNKLDTITGEFLLRPLRSVPMIVNKELKNKKLQRKNLMLGMYAMRDVIKKAEQDGLDLTGGIKVPETEQEALDMADYKSKAEVFFGRVIDKFLKTSNLKEFLYENLRELGLTAEAHARVFINEYGKTEFELISAEDAIFEEMKNDSFCLKSPYKGARLHMTKAQILNSFDLTKEEKEQIDNWFTGGQNQYVGKHGTDNNVTCAVFHIEWKGLEAWVLKEQIRNGKRHMADISHDHYMKNKAKIHYDASKGKYKIDAKFKERTYEGFCIGGDIYKNIQKAKNVSYSTENPFHCRFSYITLLFNTVGGVRVPFFALMEEVKWQYNWVRNAINKEMAKFKGVVFGYNRALLPTDKTGKPVSMNYILWRMVNDGVIDYSSHAEGNQSGKDIDINDFFKATDLGVSSTMETLIRMGQDLERLIDRLSSVNDNRQGLTSASETVTNAENNINSSRTITEPMMFYFDRFTEYVIKNILDCYKMEYLLHPEKVTEEIGEDGAEFFNDFDPSVYDIGVYVENTRMMEIVRQRVQKYIEVSLNAGELAIPDAFEVDTSETVAEAKAILRNGWERLQKMKDLQNKQAQEAQAAEKEALLNREIEFREDEQAHQMELVKAKGTISSVNIAQKSSSQQRLNQNKPQ